MPKKTEPSQIYHHSVKLCHKKTGNHSSGMETNQIQEMSGEITDMQGKSLVKSRIRYVTSQCITYLLKSTIFPIAYPSSLKMKKVSV